ncbi:MAG: indole-3-glycerol phosphate synthase TrpC [Oscillospiraceae bacterium]|nr:indole-3-glycerol phosphate synthase TrpC [Oscillospiraceae bacterium]
MNILEQICDYTRERVAAKKAHTRRFENALRGKDTARSAPSSMTFICEVKKASPSKGVICPAESFDPLAIARGYVQAGAAAISVLTEPKWFMGADEYLQNISRECDIPTLRKDFVVDEFMIYEAKFLGASAVLLICAALSQSDLERYLKIAENIGLCVLVETHDEREIDMALAAGARIIGVNNRNLKTFEVDLSLSERLRKLVPPEVVFVAESGIQTRDDVARLEAAGVQAVLIGETLMRGGSLDCLRGQ